MLFKFGKRGDSDLMNSAIMFFILNLIFLGLLFGFVVRVSSGAALYEQKYAKQISLIIDTSLPGTTFVFESREIANFAKKNKLNPSEIITFNDGIVNVKLAQGEGYSFPYFSSYGIERVVQLDSFGSVDKIVVNVVERSNE